MWGAGQGGPTNPWDLDSEEAARPVPSVGLRAEAPGRGVTQTESGKVWVDNLVGLGRGGDGVKEENREPSPDSARATPAQRQCPEGLSRLTLP